MKFTFDPEKQAINVGKHGLNFDAAPLLFEGPFVDRVGWDGDNNIDSSSECNRGDVHDFGHE